MTRPRWLGVGIAVVLFLSAAPGARAQSVSEVLAFLVTNQSVETGDFDRDRAAAQATSDTISRALLARLATLPVTTSSSSFVYRLNPTLGIDERATSSFGLFFVERALTAGSGQASIGLTFQHLHFTTLDGRKLRDGSLITTANQFVDEAAPFDVDQLALSIDTTIATLYGTYGVNDRLEIGFAAPAVTLRLGGSRVNTYRGQAFTQSRATATAIGLADVALRAKYLLYDDEGAQLAAAALVRLPTGRERDLLGAGSTSMRFSAIGSLEGHVASGHLNAGLSVGGVGREINYGGAVAVAASSRLTVSGELIGRWLGAAGEIVTSTASHPRLAGVNTLRLLANASAINLISVVPGMKWNLGDTWVLAASATLPLTDTGLMAPVTPFVGMDYTF